MAIAFSGANGGYLNATGFNFYSGNQGLTIACFFQTTTLSPADGDSTLISLESSGSWDSTNYPNIYFNASGNNPSASMFTVSSGFATITQLPNSIIAAKVWYFTALTVNVAITPYVVSLYCAQVGSPSLYSSSVTVGGAPYNATASNQIRIGDSGFGDALQGSLAGVKVWTRVLTPAELLSESRQLAPVVAGLWDYWPLTSNLDLSGRYQGLLFTPNAAGDLSLGSDPPIPAYASRTRFARRARSAATGGIAVPFWAA
jgi:Concanavalin A-like lectin/glucanases superfamily